MRIRPADDRRLLYFYVADDGAGFLSTRPAGGSGLTNMRDRLGAAGGRVWIDSSVGWGAVVHGQIPRSGKEGDPAELLTEPEIRVLRLLRGSLPLPQIRSLPNSSCADTVPGRGTCPGHLPPLGVSIGDDAII